MAIVKHEAQEDIILNSFEFLNIHIFQEQTI